MAKVAAPAPFQLEDVNASSSGSSSGTWSIRQEPMELYLGGVLTAAEIADAIANGWDDGFGAGVDSQATANIILNEVAAQGRTCRLSFAGSFGSNADVDYILGHANFGVVRGIEFESSATDDQMRYCNEELELLGKQDYLYSYQTQLGGATVAQSITGVAIAGGGDVTITVVGHGYTNGDRIGIDGVKGTTELNYKSYIIENVTTDTFDLQGVNGTGYGTYTSGGNARKGTFPHMSSWKNRSRLWYPWQISNPESSYDPDLAASATVSKAITGATQANPCVITSTAHGLSNGQIVTIKSVGGMTEINDRQFQIANVTANTFELSGEDSTSHTAYTSGGTANQDQLGRPINKSVRYDPSQYPAYQNNTWHLIDEANRNIHLWLQAFGQPMESGAWDDDYRTAVYPGMGHVTTQLVLAHFAGCKQVSFYTYRNGLFVNRHGGSTLQSGSPDVNYLPNMDNHSASGLTPTQAGVFERFWDWLNESVDNYKLRTLVANSDNAFGYESPFVEIESTAGQSATRR